MKNATIVLFLFFAISFCSCDKSNDHLDGVRVMYNNNTGYDIDSLVIGEVEIGSLKKDKSTAYFNYTSFGFDTGMPDEKCTGKILDETIESFSVFYWCGTEKYQVETGTYQMNINLIDDAETKYFRLENCLIE